MTNDKASSDDKYLFWTYGLMALIIVSLAALWVIQRRQSQRVARQLVEARDDYDRLKLAVQLKQALQSTQLPPGSIPPPKPVGIDQPVMLNGEEVTARLVAPEVGAALGLGRGDVLIVADFASEEPPAEPPDPPPEE